MNVSINYLKHCNWKMFFFSFPIVIISREWKRNFILAKIEYWAIFFVHFSGASYLYPWYTHTHTLPGEKWNVVWIKMLFEDVWFFRFFFRFGSIRSIRFVVDSNSKILCWKHLDLLARICEEIFVSISSGIFVSVIRETEMNFSVASWLILSEKEWENRH